LFDGFIFKQFENINGVKAHEETTAIEILKDIKNLNLDYLVVGVGTGGTITGVSNILKKEIPNISLCS
jgi:cysteine synthase A